MYYNYIPKCHVMNNLIAGELKMIPGNYQVQVLLKALVPISKVKLLALWDLDALDWLWPKDFPDLKLEK